MMNLRKQDLKTENAMDQMSQINREATRKRVEGYLETVRIYKQIGFVRKETSITASYEERMHGRTNAIADPVAAAGGYNVDMEYKMKAMEEQLDKALACLYELERGIIERRYLQSEEEMDFLVCQQLHLSERTYRRIKAKAIMKLALMLRLEVMKD